MEAKLKKRKLQHKMVWKGLAPKTTNYPKLIENVKKTRSNPLDNPPNEQDYPKKETTYTEKRTNQLGIEQDLVKSHPTIVKASNEAKMRLKTKFIQLLLKSSKSANSEKVNKEPEQVDGYVIPENSQKSAEYVMMEEDGTTLFLSLDNFFFTVDR